MQLPEFIKDAFPTLKATHELATELKATLGEFKISQERIQALEKELAETKASFAKAVEDALHFKKEAAAALADIRDKHLLAQQECARLTKSEAELRENPSKQAAELLASRVGVKIDDAPKADTLAKADLKPKSGFEAYREIVRKQLAPL